MVRVQVFTGSAKTPRADLFSPALEENIMSVAAQPLTPEDPTLSPGWLRIMLMVMVLGFAGLITITCLAYHNAPPITAQVVDDQGGALFGGEDIKDGQTQFLK